MIETPQIIETTTQTAAVIHMTIPREQMLKEMPPAISEITAALSDQGLSPAGPLFAHHLKMSAENFDFEVGFPVTAPITPTGRVKPGELPAVTVVRTVYHGGYEGLYTAWADFGKRIEVELSPSMEEQGLKRGTTLWESYIAGPESDPDPSTWRTELYLPLLRR